MFIVQVHSSSFPFLLWSLSLRKAKGTFFSAGTFISAGPVAGLASGKTGAGCPGVSAGCGSVPGGGASHESLLLWLRSAGFGGSAASVGCFVGVGCLGVGGVAWTV